MTKILFECHVCKGGFDIPDLATDLTDGEALSKVNKKGEHSFICWNCYNNLSEKEKLKYRSMAETIAG